VAAIGVATVCYAFGIPIARRAPPNIAQTARIETTSGRTVIASLFHPSSYLGIFVFLVLTGCGFPLPEEVAIVLAGVLSAQGHLEWEWAFVACLAGALVGDSVMYAIGRYGGWRLLHAHPRFAKLLGAQREARFEQAIQRHAFKVLLLSRFLVGIRGPVYLAAGIVRLPFRIYLLCDLVSATLVVGFFFGLSYAFGEVVAGWIRHAEVWITIIVLLAIASVGSYVYYHYRAEIYRAIFEGEKPGGAAGVEQQGSATEEQKSE
jgi:membrane protein DedA with SNARE-associated domain